MKLIPKGWPVSRLEKHGAHNFPPELPDVVRNWCNIGMVVNGLLAIVFGMAVNRTVRNGTFVPPEAFLGIFFVGPFLIKYLWSQATSFLGANSNKFSQQTFTLDFEWVAVFELWFCMLMSMASIFIVQDGGWLRYLNS